MTERESLSFPDIPDLRDELDCLVALLPPRTIATYGDLARALGSRHAAIWVSKWTEERALVDPAIRTRVVNLAGAQGGTRHADFDRPPVLQPLKEWLRHAARYVDDRPLTREPRYIAGVDVAYETPAHAVGAAVMIDAETQEAMGEAAVRWPVRFPYITGFLTFREVIPMIAALEQVYAQLGALEPDVVMVDGHGRLHPERGGVATGFAAVSGLPTIGVAKSLLCGRVEAEETSHNGIRVRRIMVDQEHRGFAVQARPNVAPIYISVGGWLSLDDALNATLMMLGSTRLPRPTHEADRLSKKRAREYAKLWKAASERQPEG